MPAPDPKPPAAGVIPRRLFFYTGGFLRERRLRRILALAGHELCLGRPGPEDGVVVWGRSRHAGRGEAVAARHGLPLVRIEDAFLRSLAPGRAGDPPLGLLMDPLGVHYDAAAPSRLERILAQDPLDDSHLLARARTGMARMQAGHLSKYNLHDPALPAPDPGYVLVVDQTLDDAAIRHGRADAATFRAMLEAARDENPGARIVLRSHPETLAGLRPGHYGPGDCGGMVSLCATPCSPWELLSGAVAVYTVSSTLGFEAILAGHRPRVFGTPFYAGWGLSRDEQPLARRGRRLTPAQLFAAAMLLAPVWYDPCRDRLCPFEAALDQIEAEVRALREDRHGHVAVGMRLWKRPALQRFFGRARPLCFAASPERAAGLARAEGRGLLVWAGSSAAGLPADLPLRRVEDGFLRSRGLGAELVAPLSLVADDLGIHYDPGRESRLERLLAAPLPPGGKERAERLLAGLRAGGVTKYNLGHGLPPDLAAPRRPGRPRILVPGQVVDDASIRLGAVGVRSPLELLRAVRAARPEALILYKPHPDVEAGLRAGAVAAADLAGLADHVLTGVSAEAALAAADEVWTITSLLGFEALLRGLPVTCLGLPFYAGWGLTRDLAPVPDRRLRRPDGTPLPRPDLLHLVHAALIAYPRYHDPVSNRPCPPEVVLDRLAGGPLPRPGAANRLLAKAQGLFAGQAWLWRGKR